MDKVTAKNLNALDDHICGMIDAFKELIHGNTDGYDNYKRIERLGRLILTIEDVVNEEAYVEMFDKAYKVVNR